MLSVDSHFLWLPSCLRVCFLCFLGLILVLEFCYLECWKIKAVFVPKGKWYRCRWSPAEAPRNLRLLYHYPFLILKSRAQMACHWGPFKLLGSQGDHSYSQETYANLSHEHPRTYYILISLQGYGMLCLKS